MKNLDVSSLAIEAVRVVRSGRFLDERGYFTETYRRGDFEGVAPLRGLSFVQANESFSRGGTIRGLHFQWNPFMGKLVRTISGRMVDVVLDIRKGSPTFGKGVMYEMPADPESEHQEWIWVPPGFAHGNYFTEDTAIEYLCTGEYSSGCEAGISPLASDIDWSLCEPRLKAGFDDVAASAHLMTSKDRDGFSVASWADDERSENFLFGEL